MKKKLFIFSFIISLFFGSVVSAEMAPAQSARFFNGPRVENITNNSADVTLSQDVLANLPEEEKNAIYFEYQQSNIVCPAIYPTPEYCLPKKTTKGQTAIHLTDLKPNTSYMVSYKKDNTIMCITAPCPGNEFQSLFAEFSTKSTSVTSFSRNLSFGSRGNDVVLLQDILREKGYFQNSSTGYFGPITLKAVINFQKKFMNISPTGFVGVRTRAELSAIRSVAVFEGVINSVSTACFADGECSVTVSGKKVITMIGWTGGPVGSVKGVSDFGALTDKIGSRVRVYAEKTNDGGYTLYGNTEYYIELLP